MGMHPSAHNGNNVMGRIAERGMPPFSIRLLDEHCQHALSCPTPPVSSANHNFMFLMKGEVLIEANGVQHLACPNECIIIPADNTFSIRYFKDCYGYMGGFSTDFLCTSPAMAGIYKGIAFVQAGGTRITRFDHSRSGFVEVLLERIMAETLAVPQSNDVIRANLNSFLVEIATESEKGQTRHNSLQNALSNRFMKMVFENGQKNLTAAEYAEKLNVSANHLNKTIKQNTGRPVTYWINESTMLAAKTLLKNTDLTMSEIAAQLGMMDPSYFARRFRQHERMSPTDYRKVVRGFRPA